MLAARPAGHQEVVFCGYGEPTLRLAEVKQLAAELRAAGHCTRLNTDGLASLVHGHDVTPELAGLFDVISVSLNAPDAASYAHHCPSKYGEAAYPAVKQFITAARKHVPKVIATVVALPNLDLDACRQVAEDELGVELRVREYNRLG
jgi:TatD DNase family protein